MKALLSPSTAGPLHRAGVHTLSPLRSVAPQTWQRDLMVDPQTSGGLLLTVEPDAVAEVLQLAHDAGFASAAVVGSLEAPSPGREAGFVSVLQ